MVDVSREQHLNEALELFFFAYREFTAYPDEILARRDLQRVHHRILYFVGRNPGITVSDLLRILAITKQSLSRVLGQLVEEGFVAQEQDSKDRRRRLLTLTEKGRGLERDLTERQMTRIARAYREEGPEAVAGFKRVLLGIVDEQNRRFLP